MMVGHVGGVDANLAATDGIIWMLRNLTRVLQATIDEVVNHIAKLKELVALARVQFRDRGHDKRHDFKILFAVHRQRVGKYRFDALMVERMRLAGNARMRLACRFIVNTERVNFRLGAVSMHQFTDSQMRMSIRNPILQTARVYRVESEVLRDFLLCERFHFCPFYMLTE